MVKLATRRKLLILGAVVFSSLAGVGAYFLIRPNPGIIRENFRRLHKGMTKADVVTILGSEGEESDGKKFVNWTGNHCHISIAFSGNDTANFGLF
jgi:hypothetical protein